MTKQELPIATPCSADWKEMSGGATCRFCEACAKPVYNLSAMPRWEARNAVAEHGAAGMCVVYRHDRRGRLVFNDRRAGLWGQIRGAVRALIVAFAAMSGAGPLMTACGGVPAVPRHYAPPSPSGTPAQPPAPGSQPPPK